MYFVRSETFFGLTMPRDVWQPSGFSKC